ncbi:uncharacterized protein LOC111685096 [Lucilia cuprina]|uniref:uncharacterized protein LOC111685096 n=1 Tax=Lucilia cuprina TaxID=7375 RepID=UPI001F0554F2|nr:uncharacterized protein LOC111685096 [Lucilia cuprina]
MANNKKVKRGFYQLPAKVSATAIVAARTKTTTINENNTRQRQTAAKLKTRSHCNFTNTICNMNNNSNRKTNSNKCLQKNEKDTDTDSRSSNSNNSCCSSSSSSFNVSPSCSQSLSLFYFSCNSPNSIITFITTTICYCIRYVYKRCYWWWSLQQRQQKQYKIKTKTLSNFYAAPATSITSSATTITTSPSSSSLVNNRNFCSSLKWHFFLWLFLSILAPCISLTMTEVRIPKHIMRHETAALGCKYDLDGESLYSVKWYKDGFEFYRYVPRDMPPGQVFPLPGVDVDLQNSTDNVVVLNRVTLQSTGRYRCEVSGEAPSFQTVSGHEDMIVVGKHSSNNNSQQPNLYTCNSSLS